MAHLMQPTGVQVVTKEGECVINLQIDLNININELASAVKAQAKMTEKTKEEDSEDVAWAIPDFGSANKIEFGKKE